MKPVVPFSACLEMLTREETLPDYRSPATGRPGPAVKHVRFKNFPRYLMVKLSRYVKCVGSIDVVCIVVLWPYTINKYMSDGIRIRIRNPKFGTSRFDVDCHIRKNVF